MYFAYTFVIFRLQLPPAVKQMSMTKVSKRKRYWSNKQYLLVFFSYNHRHYSSFVCPGVENGLEEG